MIQKSADLSNTVQQTTGFLKKRCNIEREAKRKKTRIMQDKLRKKECNNRNSNYRCVTTINESQSVAMNKQKSDKSTGVRIENKQQILAIILFLESHK